MADIAQLGIEIDTRKLKSGEKDLASFSSAAQKVDDTVKTATKTMLAFVGAASVGEIIKIADKMTQLNAKINLYTKSATEATAVMSQLNSIANASGSSIGAVSELYTRMAASLQSMGATQGQILQLTDTINKLGIVSGASPEAMSNAMMQLSQSMAGGIVRAEEFNSIMENTPMIAQEVAKSMGISMGELRNQMLAGKLSAQDFANALLAGSARADEMASKMPRTVGQATQALSNNFAQLVNSINTATSSTSVISSAIDDVAASFLDLSSAFASGQIGAYAESFAVQWKTAGSDVSAVMDSIVNIFDAGLKAVDADGRDSAQFLSDAFWQFPANVKAAIQVIVVELASLVDKAAVYGKQIAFYLDPRNWGDGEQIDSYVEHKIARINKARDATIDGFMAERTAAITASNEMKKQAGEVRAAYDKTAQANRISLSSSSITGGKAATATAASATAAKKAEALENKKITASQYVDELKMLADTQSSKTQAITKWEDDNLNKLKLYRKQGLITESDYSFGVEAVQKESLQRQEELIKQQREKAAQAMSSASSGVDISGGLASLKSMYDQRLITEQQYNQQSAILKDQWKTKYAEVDNWLVTELATYKQLLADKTINEQQYNTASNQLHLQWAQKRREVLLAQRTSEQTEMQTWLANIKANMTSSTGLMTETFNSFTSNIASGLTNAIIQADSFGDAMRNAAASFAQSMIQAIIQVMAQKAVMWALEKSLGAATNSAYVGMIAGQSGAAVQMAGLNAYASTAAIPIVGPAAAPAAMATAIGATAPLATAAVASAASSISGMAHDGISSVPSEGTWLLNKGERVYTNDSAKQLDQMYKNSQQSSGGNVTVNVSLQETSDASKQGTTSQTTGDDGSVQVNVFVADIRSEGSMAQVLERTYGLTRMGA